MTTVDDEANGNSSSLSPLTLSVPEPAGRPGDVPNFEAMIRFTAGETRRPTTSEDPSAMDDLATGLIRVLDDGGRAQGPWNPVLDAHALVSGLEHMMVTRELDRRMLLEQRQGKTSFYMQCLGEEAVACAFQVALRDGDMNFPTYRQQGLLVAADYPLELMISQVYSNALDPLRGRQMPVFYSAKEFGFFSISGNLSTQYVQAVGWAMASAIDGDTAISAAWIGEGATAESDFHAAMVMASTYNAPVVLNIVNNQWAISTSQVVTRGRAPTFASRARGFGIPALRVDGNDYLAVYAAASWAIERARRNLGPTLIEWVTYRAAAHSSSDDPSSYRPKDETAAWPYGDPIDRLMAHLVVSGVWSQSEHDLLRASVEERVDAAQSKAESYGTLRGGPAPSGREMFEDVFSEVPAHLVLQRQEAGF